MSRLPSPWPWPRSSTADSSWSAMCSASSCRPLIGRGGRWAPDLEQRRGGSIGSLRRIGLPPTSGPAQGRTPAGARAGLGNTAGQGQGQEVESSGERTTASATTASTVIAEAGRGQEQEARAGARAGNSSSNPPSCAPELLGDQQAEWWQQVLSEGEGARERAKDGGVGAGESVRSEQRQWWDGPWNSAASQQNQLKQEKEQPLHTQQEAWGGWRAQALKSWQSFQAGLRGALEAVGERRWWAKRKPSRASAAESSRGSSAGTTPELDSLVSDIRRLGLSSVLLGAISLLHLYAHGHTSPGVDAVLGTLSSLWFLFLVLDSVLTASTWALGANAFALLMENCPLCGGSFYYHRDHFRHSMTCPHCFEPMQWGKGHFVRSRPRYSRTNYGHDGFGEESEGSSVSSQKPLSIVDISATVRDDGA